MDQARKKTDKMLSKMEKQIDRLYDESPKFKKVKRKYDVYMRMVENRVKDDFRAFSEAEDTNTKNELKGAYFRKLRALTVENKAYNDIIDELTDVLAEINQQALDIVNGQMEEIYILNYNQVAVDCRRAGIKVNG